MNSIELSQSQRRAARVLRMVHELHKRGYQLLRICPGMAPSGLYWRCSVTVKANILTNHGAMSQEFDRHAVHYSTGDENHYFGWTDAGADTAWQLADKFELRFPELLELAKGRDWPYVGWFVEMLGLAEKGIFPIAYSDYGSTSTPRYLETVGGAPECLPMPPGGDAMPEA